ncbi:phospholipase D-like domain-containing protein [Neobacillus rhizosphaerae]|uniref:phospholipase D-like domain-containing protein n=1 Tax=Neobacillus rhizosphaerae TaxID=2880965 RepID=UPI003D2C9299
MPSKKQSTLKKVFSIGALSTVLFSTLFTGNEPAKAVTNSPVAINEVAWMGTSTSYNNEWMELKNNTSQDLSLTGWKLQAKDGSPSINLSGTVKAGSYFLLERSTDDAVVGVKADQIYTGALGNSAEALELYDANGNLVDTVSSWYAGDNNTKATMERVNAADSGDVSSNWKTATAAYDGGFGTPKLANSVGTSQGTIHHLNHVSNADGAINVYFNKTALPQFAYDGNEANWSINLEDQLVSRISQATSSIDVATYELNLPKIVNTLVDKASQGVTVRVVADAKDVDPNDTENRYGIHRLNLEKLIRGKDQMVGTADDAHILGDSAMFVEEDATLRAKYGLPASFDDFPVQTVKIGSGNQTGHLLVDAERKADGSYYAPGDQMHNKFMIIDGKWVWTGTWNFTETGTYGTDEDMNQDLLNGNQNQTVEINSVDLASIYKTEFQEMYGSNTAVPNPTNAKFHSRKTDNTAHQVNVNGTLVEVYFSPGDGALNRITNAVKNEAQHRAYFEIFAFSDQTLVNELKYKWEGSYNDMEGTRTGFDMKGLFDPSFWNQWWSASVDMTQRTASQTSVDNPNTRWNTPAPVYTGKESRKLHAKTMIIDPNTSSDPMVVVGSTNWSSNGDATNDENMLVIHSDKIANQFLQEFYARYQVAGGQVPSQEAFIQ